MEKSAEKVVRQERQSRRLSKKISIFLDYESETSSEPSSLFSEDIFMTKHSVHGMPDIVLPYLKLSTDLVKKIFLVPSLFLMNLSLCLLLKYSYYTNT